MITDNEKIYDEQISPLMAQIIEICKKHKIPMLATFIYKQDGFCTTSMPVSKFYPEDKESPENIALIKAHNCIYKQPEFFAFTITSSK